MMNFIYFNYLLVYKLFLSICPPALRADVNYNGPHLLVTLNDDDDDDECVSHGAPPLVLAAANHSSPGDDAWRVPLP